MKFKTTMKPNPDINKIKWSIDPVHSEISFKVKHLMISHVRGIFKNFNANIYTIGHDFTTLEIDIWIDPASILTGNTGRDEHLEGPEFFDVKKHKQITFVSHTINKNDIQGSYEIWGNLQMMGITKNVMLLAVYGGLMRDSASKEKAGFTITGVINRTDWGLNWNSDLPDGGFVVGQEIQILCELELKNEGLLAELRAMDFREMIL